MEKGERFALQAQEGVLFALLGVMLAHSVFVVSEISGGKVYAGADL